MGRASNDSDYPTLAEFEELLPDRPRNERWELIGGRLVRLMAGALGARPHRAEHRLRVGTAVRDPALVLPDLLHEVPAARPAMLSDVIVVRGDLGPGATFTESPVVLVEVLPAGTEARDRFERWHAYQQLPALRHSVPVKHPRPHLEAFDRVEGPGPACARSTGSTRCRSFRRSRRACRSSTSTGACWQDRMRAARPLASRKRHSVSGAMGSRPPMWRWA